MVKIVKLKQMHINLTDEKQVADYEIVKAFYNVQGDNDLVRLLFAMEAGRIRGEFPLLNAQPETKGE